MWYENQQKRKLWKNKNFKKFSSPPYLASNSKLLIVILLHFFFAQDADIRYVSDIRTKTLFISLFLRQAKNKQSQQQTGLALVIFLSSIRRMLVVSISTTTAVVYALSCSFFFLLIFLLVCMGLEPSQRLVGSY